MDPRVFQSMSSGIDTFGYWLDMAGRWPLLPKEHVIRLANTIQNPETTDIQKRRAVDKLVKHNLRLIPNIVRRCTANKRSFNFGDPNCEDLLQVGTIGLKRAAELYDPKRGYAFSTYAVHWIYQAVQREIYETACPIRIPETTLRELYLEIKKTDGYTFDDLEPRKRERLHDALRASIVMSIDYKFDKQQETNAVDRLSDSNKITETGVPMPLRDHDDFMDISSGRQFHEIISIPALSDTQRRMFTMLYEQNATKKEVQEELDLSPQRLDTQLKRGLNALRFSLGC